MEKEDFLAKVDYLPETLPSLLKFIACRIYRAGGAWLGGARGAYRGAPCPCLMHAAPSATSRLSRKAQHMVSQLSLITSESLSRPVPYSTLCHK